MSRNPNQSNFNRNRIMNKSLNVALAILFGGTASLALAQSAKESFADTFATMQALSSNSSAWQREKPVFSKPNNPMGKVVPQLGMMRTIRIDAKTKYVNVTADETIRFESSGNAFAINFGGGGLSVFDLNQIAPTGVLDHKVTVYVAPNPLYLS
jgi:hypothetical protein